MRFLLTALIPSLAGAAALAGTSSQGPDFDGLATCSVIYQDVGEKYAAKGDAESGASFADTALAYSAAAFLLIGGGRGGGDDAQRYAEDRLETIAESLNAAAASDPEGDLGVIADWLPWCDSLGGATTAILQQGGYR